MYRLILILLMAPMTASAVTKGDVDSWNGKEKKTRSHAQRCTSSDQCGGGKACAVTTPGAMGVCVKTTDY